MGDFGSLFIPAEPPKIYILFHSNSSSDLIHLNDDAKNKKINED